MAASSSARFSLQSLKQTRLASDNATAISLGEFLGATNGGSVSNTTEQACGDQRGEPGQRVLAAASRRELGRVWRPAHRGSPQVSFRNSRSGSG